MLSAHHAIPRPTALRYCLDDLFPDGKMPSTHPDYFDHTRDLGVTNTGKHKWTHAMCAMRCLVTGAVLGSSSGSPRVMLG